MGSSRHNGRLMAAAWCVAVIAALGLSGFNLTHGSLNQDEGWYLYGARLVREGQQPYVDFATTQGPVMTYVYAMAYPLVERFGVAGGRLFTMVLGWMTALLAALLAARLVPPDRKRSAALLCFVLIGVNIYNSYFTTIVKTYSLTALLLVSGFLALSFVRRRRWWPAAVAGILVALAAGTRSSAGFVAPPMALWLAVAAWRGAGAPPGRKDSAQVWAQVNGRHVLAFCVAAGITLPAIFLPFLIKSPQGVWFALYEYHAGRVGAESLFAQLAYKVGFFSRLVRAYFVPIGLLVVAIAPLAFRKNHEADRKAALPPGDRLWSFGGLLWASLLSVTLIHAVAPFPYDDYQVIVSPLLAVAVADLALRRLPPAEKQAPVLVLVVLALCLLSAGSSHRVQDWFVGKQDRLWWPLREQTPLARLRETAGLLNDMAEDGEFLLTQDPYLAVESGLRLPAGLELGPFSFFPHWSREKAQTLHVLNEEMFIELIRTNPAPVAAFSGYGLAVEAPRVSPLSDDRVRSLWNAVSNRYELVMEVQDFGQAETTLRILRQTRNRRHE